MTYKLSIFEGKEIRKLWHNEEWWFVIEDIVLVLTGSTDPKQYINKMRQRDEQLDQGWVQLVHTLSIDTLDSPEKHKKLNKK